MKKLLSLLLVLCMTFSVCLAFTSCNGDPNATTSEETVKNDPAAALGTAFDRTTSEMFPDELGFGAIVEEAFKNGAFSIGLGLDEDLVGTDIEVLEKIYFNNTDKKYVSDTTVTVDKETYGGRIFVDKDGIAVNSEDILGTDETFLLNIANFVENFEDSALAEMLLGSTGLNDESMDMILEVLEEVGKTYDKLFSGEYEEEYKEQMKAYAKMLGETVSSETIEDKTYTVVSYTLNNKAVKNILESVLEIYDLPKDIMDQMEDAIDEMVEELNDNAIINIVFKTYIDNSVNVVNKVTISGSITPVNYADQSLEFNATIDFAPTEIKLTFEGSVADDEIVADVTLTRKTEGDKNIYELVVNGGDNKGATVNAFNASVTHNTNNGKLVIAADIYNDGDDRMEVEVTGSLKVEGDKATLAFDSASAMGETVEFELEFTFEKSATAPALPSDATDISTLTKEDFEEIMKDIEENSKLAKLFG